MGTPGTGRSTSLTLTTDVFLQLTVELQRAHGGSVLRGLKFLEGGEDLYGGGFGERCAVEGDAREGGRVCPPGMKRHRAGAWSLSEKSQQETLSPGQVC
jgi:hypothetical protein